jgi:hypothetical protein
MNNESLHELPVFKQGTDDPVKTKLTLEAQGAVREGGLPSSMYRPASNEHLPVVTFSSQYGASESIHIDRGHTFTAAVVGGDKGVVKQFDAKTGRLVSEDDVQMANDYHTVFDPISGKPVSGTRVSDWGSRQVEQDHFDRNGKLQSSDTTYTGMTEHTQYNSQGDETRHVTTDLSGTGNATHIRTVTYLADGTMVADDKYPNSNRPEFADVDRVSSKAFVSFDPKTGKPNSVLLGDKTGSHNFRIDETTGTASRDYLQDLKDSGKRLLWAISPN